MNNPIPFIQDVKGQGFVVTPEAANVLANCFTKIAVVVIAGPYRTGKSFLLNKLIGCEKKQGFSVGGTVNACTKGIWLWGKPVKVGDTSYIFLDSEGLGSLEQEQGFDVQIFSLAILLSSMFVLNTQGTINEKALEELELVVECSRKIRLSESQSDVSADLGRLNPIFTWVLRDFVLELRDNDGNAINSKEYLEKALEPVQGSRKAVEKNRIRSAVRDFFPDRDCITLVRPVSDEKDLALANTLPENKLRPEFIEQISILKQKVFSSKCKRIEGDYVTGPALVGLARKYCEAINQGCIPTIRSAWESVVTIQAQNALQAAVALYQSEYPADSNVVEESDLRERHAQCSAACMTLLNERAVGDPSFKLSLEKKLGEALSKELQTRLASNLMQSTLLCRSTLDQAWLVGAFDTKKFASGDDFRQSWASLMSSYEADARGPAKLSVWI
jgi:hypothetical protein